MGSKSPDLADPRMPSPPASLREGRGSVVGGTPSPTLGVKTNGDLHVDRGGSERGDGEDEDDVCSEIMKVEEAAEREEKKKKKPSKIIKALMVRHFVI